MIGTAPARSFLLTVHEPGSAVLEDLRTGQRAHVAELADLGARIADWLAAAPDESHPRPGARPPSLP